MADAAHCTAEKDKDCLSPVPFGLLTAQICAEKNFGTIASKREKGGKCVYRHKTEVSCWAMFSAATMNNREDNRLVINPNFNTSHLCGKDLDYY